MPTYDVPGVYIEEQTGPGVIAGVGTSTAAFIGPALAGPINEARRISSFDEFLELYGIKTSQGTYWPYITDPRNFYLAHAVRGFYTNGGKQAYIVRAGNGRKSFLSLLNQNNEETAVVQAAHEGSNGDQISIEIQTGATQATRVANSLVNAVNGAFTQATVADASGFRMGDIVTEDNNIRVTIIQIEGNTITFDNPINNLAANDTLRIANLPPNQASVRLIETGAFYNGMTMLLSGEDANNLNTIETERVVVQSVNHSTSVVTFANAPARAITYNMNVAQQNAPTLTGIRTIAIWSSAVTNINNTDITVADAAGFRPGDRVTEDNVSSATITAIQGNVVTVSAPIAGLAINDTLRIANFSPALPRIRVNDFTGLYSGTVVVVTGNDAQNPNNIVNDYAIIDSVDPLGFVTFRAAPPRVNTFDLTVNMANSPYLTTQEFRMVVHPPGGSGRPDGYINTLSLDPFHPRYLFNSQILDEIKTVDSTTHWVSVLPPQAPPTTIAIPGRLMALTGATPLAGGQDDLPTALTATHYQQALNVLADIDDVNMICIPDASSHPDRQSIQSAMINHCLLPQLQDRVAILDSIQGAPPSGPNSVELQRAMLQSDRGFAALYYPWLVSRDPAGNGPVPRTMPIPPCGHIAGIFARVDNERGVHKAPANVTLRGALGLENVISDGQHGPLNLGGTNVLRIFPGSGAIYVWGARTTVDPNITDWLYINVRRLMLFIEESIEEGIRWAVFEPNNLALWQNLKRTINDFLFRIWKSGALFGETAQQAYYVRIDEALNPPSTRAIGRLYIEIGVAPVRPAEFIIVRIGLWDNGSEVAEG